MVFTAVYKWTDGQKQTVLSGLCAERGLICNLQLCMRPLVTAVVVLSSAWLNLQGESSDELHMPCPLPLAPKCLSNMLKSHLSTMMQTQGAIDRSPSPISHPGTEQVQICLASVRCLLPSACTLYPGFGGGGGGQVRWLFPLSPTQARWEVEKWSSAVCLFSKIGRALEDATCTGGNTGHI